MSTIIEVKNKFTNKLDQLDLDLILEFVLKKPRSFLLAHPEYKITNNQETITKKYINRRIKGEPLAYILGEKEFYGFNFKVNKNVLVPRPETEMLVEEALRHVAHNTQHITLIDIGTGSGNIIISILKNLCSMLSVPCYISIGIDISQKALIVAKKNAKLHGINKQIKFIKGNLLEPILNSKISNLKSKIIITANLPYVEDKWEKQSKLHKNSLGLKYEPKIALYAGEDGLDLYRKLADQIKILKEKTNSPITVICEIGNKQANKMKKIFSFAKKITVHKDLNGHKRVVIIEI